MAPARSVVTISEAGQSFTDFPQVLWTPANLHLPARRTDSRFTG
jgi:hypothetical protein